jgi:hypothetical protein
MDIVKIKEEISMIEIAGEVYCTATGAAKYLNITRFMFYYNVKDRITAYQFPVRRKPLYKRSELEPFRIVNQALPVVFEHSRS